MRSNESSFGTLAFAQHLWRLFRRSARGRQCGLSKGTLARLREELVGFVRLAATPIDVDAVPADAVAPFGLPGEDVEVEPVGAALRVGREGGHDVPRRRRETF